MDKIRSILERVEIPKMIRIRQHFNTTTIENIREAIWGELSRSEITQTIKPGMRIAITAGSRGIANYALIIKSIAEYVKSKSAIPFVVPAMGSHANAVAEGQRQILTQAGITQDYIGCEILSSMETVCIGKTDAGNDVYIDIHAAQADGIIVLGRVKPHPSFRGEYESGIMKMMAIGLGKQYGAQQCHAKGFKEMAQRVPEFGKAVVKHSNVIFAVAIIENAFEKTYKLRAIPANKIADEEPVLLEEARRQMGRIPFAFCDTLIVDQIGKEISGGGQDPNVIGRFVDPLSDSRDYISFGFKCDKLVVLDITDKSHGNCSGIGLSDFTTTRLVNKCDRASTYINCLTAREYRTNFIPLYFDDDATAIRAGMYFSDRAGVAPMRVIRIQNTLYLEEMFISEALLDEARANPSIEILGEPTSLPFDADGNLL